MAGPIILDQPMGVLALSFARHAELAQHAARMPLLVMVTAGGGWAEVDGSEPIAIREGDAFLWPAGIPHRAWTEGDEMHALVIECLAGLP